MMQAFTFDCLLACLSLKSTQPQRSGTRLIKL